MNVEEAKKIITDQRGEVEEAFRKKRLIERSVPKERLEQAISHPNILAILGIRRCGKSVLSHMIMRERKYGYVNFDDELFFGIEARELNGVLQALYELYGTDLEYLVLDEIQNVPGWELFANRLRRTKKVILTGSNAKLLSGELATHLTGRYTDFVLYPFSFREFLDWKGLKPDTYSTKSAAETKNALNEYIGMGGFPEAYLLGRGATSRVYEDIIYKDIISRHGIRNKKSFMELARCLVSGFSREFSFRKLKEATSIKNVHTVKNYVDYMESAYLVFVVSRFSSKLKEQLVAPRKIYCIDTGIINTVAFKSSQDTGRLMENVVAIELKRRIEADKSIYYWKDYRQREVDFVLTEGERVQKLIQVSYSSDASEVRERELNGLTRASAELKCDDLSVITWDYESEEKYDGKSVKFVPLWKWLLEKNGTNNKSRPA